jgi:hypothetical protein
MINYTKEQGRPAPVYLKDVIADMPEQYKTLLENNLESLSFDYIEYLAQKKTFNENIKFFITIFPYMLNQNWLKRRFKLTKMFKKSKF